MTPEEYWWIIRELRQSRVIAQNHKSVGHFANAPWILKRQADIFGVAPIKITLLGADHVASNI